MSRVDDAIRRAAELQAAKAAALGTTVTPAAGETNAESYPAETFPVESFPVEAFQPQAPEVHSSAPPVLSDSRSGELSRTEPLQPETIQPPPAQMASAVDAARSRQLPTDAPPAAAFDSDFRAAAAAADVMRPAPPAAPATVENIETRSDGRHVERAENTIPSLFERIDARFSEKVIVDSEMMPASREQYRRLAAVLHDGQGESGLKVIMIASAVAGEGKTLTASNLALTFSESYHRRVLLVDGDLRRPVIHSVFRLHPASGLSEGLRTTETKLVVRQVSPYLSVLPGGRPDADPMAGLTSTRMRRLITEAKDAFDWVVIDTPPLVLLPDAHLLASMVDGVVLVIRANSTPYALVKRAVDSLGRDRVVGVVLNAASAVPAGADAYYYNYSPSPQLAEARTQS